MALTVLYQAIIMLILIAAGIVFAKTGKITEKTCSELSWLLLSIVNPVMIFLAYQKEFEKKFAENLIITLALSFLAMALGILTSYILIRNVDDNTAVKRFSVVYSNCGFMGLPLINAMYGYDGVFYLTAYLTAYNLLAWSHGVIQMSGKKDFHSVLKVFYSPTMIAIYLGLIFFLTPLKLPKLINDTLQFVSDLNTPLAMFVAGGSVARSNILKALRTPQLYFITAIKLLVIPILTALAVAWLPVDGMVKTVVVVSTAAPSATMGTLFAMRYHRNAGYASEIFAATTFLSTVTLPIVTWITTLLW